MVQILLTQLATQRPFRFPSHPASVPALPGEIRTGKILHFYLRQYDYLSKITHIKRILSRFLSLWLTVYAIVQLSNCLQKIFEISALCEHTGTQMLSPFIDSSVDNVLLQTSTSHFLDLSIKNCTYLYLFLPVNTPLSTAGTLSNDFRCVVRSVFSVQSCPVVDGDAFPGHAEHTAWFHSACLVQDTVS